MMTTFDWRGEGFTYGQKVSFFQITYEDVPLVFCIYKTTSFSDEPFVIERIKKNIKSININDEIEEEIKNIYLIKTDDDFRKEFKRSCYILKFVTETEVVTIGAYTDNQKKMTPDNLYLLCERDFINVLAKGELVESVEQIEMTAFDPLKPIFNKKELAKELLRE